MIGDNLGQFEKRGYDDHPYAPLVERLEGMDTEGRVKLLENVAGAVAALAITGGILENNILTISGWVLLACAAIGSVLRRHH